MSLTSPHSLPDLPVVTVLPALKRALATRHTAILEAPPGAGKTTLAPLTLLDAHWLAGRRIVMLEPRRLAAQWAARRMATLCGEAVGETVGYQIRMDRHIGPHTRIEVLTEGILTQRILHDPELQGVGLLIFDEYHERSLQADLGLALAREVQQALRPDLRLLIMSATLDTADLAARLDAPALVRSEGRQYPVETRYLRETPPCLELQSVVDAICRALDSGAGDLLVFLPGEGEIRRCQERLKGTLMHPHVAIRPLYGALPRDAQDAAIAPAPAGCRKVVLATSIAESSLTIEGVTTVIDSGWMRMPRFSPRSGMTRLDTLRLTGDRAEQRRGRAGRLGPGRCFRLWAESTQAQLLPSAQPEIEIADLTPVVLAAADWGARTAAALPWVTPPPAGAWQQAGELLLLLDALTPAGEITPRGRAMARLPMHPRLAHMLLLAQHHGDPKSACLLAAAISLDLRLPRDHPSPCDADALLAATRDPRARLRGAEGARRLARDWMQRISAPTTCRLPAGRLLSWAYPDRVGRAKPGSRGAFLLVNGRTAHVHESDVMAGAEWIAAAHVDDGARGTQIYLAGSVSGELVRQERATELVVTERVLWDPREERILARRETRLGAILLAARPLREPSPERIAEAVLAMLRGRGLDLLPWRAATRQFTARVALLRRVLPEEEWPDLSSAALIDTLDHWLGPAVRAVRNLRDLAALDLMEALRSQLTWRQCQELETLAPTHWSAPGGARIRLDYASGEIPALPVRIQEVFGLRETPRIARGRQPLRLELLSPARRPVQITMDLPSFWRSGYTEARRELRGRYPKHHWPEDPTTAEPSQRGLKPRKSG